MIGGALAHIWLNAPMLGDLVQFIEKHTGVTAIRNSIDQISNMVGWVMTFVHDPGKAFGKLFKWAVGWIFPKQMQEWFQGTIYGGKAQGGWGAKNGDYIYHQLYNAMAPIGLTFAGLGAMARIVRGVADHRAPASMLLADTLPRMLIGYATLNIGFDVMAWIVDAAVVVANYMVAAVQSGVSTPKQSFFTLIVTAFLPRLLSIPLLLILLIPMILLQLYVLFLIIVRGIMLAFAVAVAPLCIATAIYDPRNKFFQWWMDLFFGAVLIPVVLFPSVALTGVLAADMLGVPFVGPFAACIMACGGLWFTAKVVHQLTWRHFSHGGVLGAITAGAAALYAAPLVAMKGVYTAKALGVKIKPDGFWDKLAKVGVAGMGFDPNGGGGGGGGGSDMANAVAAQMAGKGGLAGQADAAQTEGRIASDAAGRGSGSGEGVPGHEAPATSTNTGAPAQVSYNGGGGNSAYYGGEAAGVGAGTRSGTGVGAGSGGSAPRVPVNFAAQLGPQTSSGAAVHSSPENVASYNAAVNKGVFDYFDENPGVVTQLTNDQGLDGGMGWEDRKWHALRGLPSGEISAIADAGVAPWLQLGSAPGSDGHSYPLMN